MERRRDALDANALFWASHFSLTLWRVERIECRLWETEEGRQRLSKADDRVTEALVRESERIMRATSRDDAEMTSRGG